MCGKSLHVNKEAQVSRFAWLKAPTLQACFLITVLQVQRMCTGESRFGKGPFVSPRWGAFSYMCVTCAARVVMDMVKKLCVMDGVMTRSSASCFFSFVCCLALGKVLQDLSRDLWVCLG